MVSLSSDDTPTGPIVGARVQPLIPDSIRKRNTVRNLTAGALVLIAPLFPWNLYFGLRIPDSSILIWLVLGLVTLLSLASLLVSRPRFNPVLTSQLRLALNVPYLLLVLAFIAYDSFQTIRSGGTVHVPGGVGPGAWLGTAGAVLSAQPPLVEPIADDERYYHRWLRSARILGYASMFGAALSAGFNLCWRVRFALQAPDGSVAFGTQNFAVLVTAVVYGMVALAAVLVASRWVLRGDKPSRLAVLALGASTLVAGIIVWILPLGREIDAFHGIAQNTSTAGVGYEGYLAWAAAAAMFAPLILFSSPNARADRNVWREAIRKGLLLIGIWCLSSVLMRLTDLVVGVILNYPYSRYDIMTLAAFDLITAVLALWLRFNLANQVVPARLISGLSGLVFTLTIARVVVGVVLAPRFVESPGVSQNPVYGNNLAQQIDSTFDVVLCGLAFCIVAAVFVLGRLRRPARPPRHPRRGRRPSPPRLGPAPHPGPARHRVAVPSEAKTMQFGVATAVEDDDAPTADLSRPAPAPRIFRPAGPAQQSQQSQQSRPQIFRPPGAP